MSAAGEAVARVRISEVWFALGGGSLRHDRGRAFWRDGDGFNVSLSDDKNCWHDFVTGEGGGVLDLVQHVRSGSRSEALRFVAGLVGIVLDEKAISREERRVSAIHHHQAEHVAQVCSWWARATSLELERAKARAYESGDFETLYWAGRELYQIQQAGPSALMARFVKAMRDDRRNTMTLVESGRQDEQHAYAVTAMIVAMLVKAVKAERGEERNRAD
jgi:hypothetical protein